MSETLHSNLEADLEMTQLVEAYVARLPEQVAEIQNAVSAGDLASLRRITHQLKGSGAGYGFDPITKVAANAVHAIDAGKQMTSVSACINNLIATLRSVSGYDTGKEE